MTVLKLKVDLHGVMANTADTLRGRFHPLRGKPTADDRRSAAAMLDMIAGHIIDVREGRATLEEFGELYCLTPRSGALG